MKWIYMKYKYRNVEVRMRVNKTHHNSSRFPSKSITTCGITCCSLPMWNLTINFFIECVLVSGWWRQWWWRRGRLDKCLRIWLQFVADIFSCREMIKKSEREKMINQHYCDIHFWGVWTMREILRLNFGFANKIWNFKIFYFFKFQILSKFKFRVLLKI